MNKKNPALENTDEGFTPDDARAALDASLDEPADDASAVAPRAKEPFAAVRSGGYLYAEYADGTKEYYDLNADPYELRNLLPTSASVNSLAGSAKATLPALQTALSKLRGCRAGGCQQ